MHTHTCTEAVITSCFVPWMYLTYSTAINLFSDLLACFEVDLKDMCVDVHMFQTSPSSLNRIKNK